MNHTIVTPIAKRYALHGKRHEINTNGNVTVKGLDKVYSSTFILNIDQV